MKRVWRLLGVASFWLLLPVLVPWLNRSERARVLMVCGDEMLVTQSWLGMGKWGLPGGGLRRGEAPIDGALREVREETGLHLEKGQLRELFSAPYTYRRFRYPCHYYVVVFARRPVVSMPRFEIVEYAWISPRKLTKQNSHPDTLSVSAVWFGS